MASLAVAFILLKMTGFLVFGLCCVPEEVPNGLDQMEALMLTETIKTDLKQSVLCWLATVDAVGQPNVSPKEIFCLDGSDALVIANIASPVSARNIMANASVCVSFVDIFRQRGFKLQGQARLILPHDPEFAIKGHELINKAGPDFIIQSLFYIRITNVRRILAPSYSIFPDRTVEEHMANSYKTYGVSPA